MRQKSVTSTARITVGLATRDTVFRWIAAGPLTLIAAVVTMACMPLWLPKGAAGIDNLIFPILLFPALWAGYFFYSLIVARPARGALVITAIIIVNAALIFSRF